MCESGEGEARLVPFRCAILLREMQGGHPAHPRIACDAPSLVTLLDGFKSNPASAGFSFKQEKHMKMGRKDPRASMSKSVRAKSPINPTGRNPIKSASPYETPGVGEDCSPTRTSQKAAPVPDSVADDDAADDGED